MKIKRYPPTKNNSLKAWSAADEYLLAYLEEQNISSQAPLIYQDRFGYLSCHLVEQMPTVIVNYKSQEKAILQNFSQNRLDEEKITLKNSLEKLKQPAHLVLIRIPKSLDLLKLYFQQMSRVLTHDSLVLGAFMTKHFSPNYLKIAALYFGEVIQSKAWKKARLLILKKPKVYQKRSCVQEVPFDDTIKMRQYFGVFSANRIDWATQFLIKNLQLPNRECFNVIDLASGNGILAKVIRRKRPKVHLHLVDDNFLAIASSKLNLDNASNNILFHYQDNLDHIPSNSIDFIVSNPPFHFEHETNIEVSHRLFSGVARVLKAEGHFQLVANKHLNYKIILSQLFHIVEVCAANEKFIIYLCKK